MTETAAGCLRPGPGEVGLADLLALAPIRPWPSAPIDLFVLSLDRARSRLPGLVRLIPPDERRRFEAMRNPLRRRQRLLSRAALGLALAEMGGPGLLPPAGPDGFGKPRLPGRRGDFSLAYAGDLVCLAVSADGAVGVDVEVLPEALAASAPLFALTPSERARLEALSPPEAAGAFTRAWTAKEAAAKCLGLGVHAEFSAIETGLGSTVDCAELGMSAPMRLYRTELEVEGTPCTLALVASCDNATAGTAASR